MAWRVSCPLSTSRAMAYAVRPTLYSQVQGQLWGGLGFARIQLSAAWSRSFNWNEATLGPVVPCFVQIISQISGLTRVWSINRGLRGHHQYNHISICYFRL